MADETITEGSTILAPPAQGKTTQFPLVIDPVNEPLDTAPGRLRTFEDDKLGPDAVRINGQIERGYGSKFRDLSPEDQAHYAALERLVEAEQKLADARAALAVAESAFETAQRDVNHA